MVVVRKAERMPDGSLVFDRSQRPPMRFHLYVAVPGDPWRFAPDFPACVHRSHERVQKETG